MTIEIAKYKDLLLVRDGMIAKKKVFLDGDTPVAVGLWGRFVRFIRLKKGDRQQKNKESLANFIKSMRSEYGAEYCQNLETALSMRILFGQTLRLRDVQIYLNEAERLRKNAPETMCPRLQRTTEKNVAKWQSTGDLFKNIKENRILVIGAQPETKWGGLKIVKSATNLEMHDSVNDDSVSDCSFEFDAETQTYLEKAPKKTRKEKT